MKIIFTFRYIAILFFSFLFFNSSYSQQIDSMINLYGERFPQEKIHVHFDKPVYNAGETIWFKAYLFAGIMPSFYSKTMYAELINPAGQILQRKVIPMFENSFANQMDLPGNTPAGIYYFRAYTTWMLNFDTAFLFTKPLRIINPASSNTDTANETINASLQFFPEGGDLVTGLESQIAFKATDQYGNPISVKGSIKSSEGNAVTNFSSVHNGMGKFVLTPLNGTAYYAEWTDENGKQHKTDLPAAKTHGASLHLRNSKKVLYFVVRRSLDGPVKYKTMYVVGHFNQQLVYKAKLNLGENFMTSATIPTNDIPTGILQLTLFDSVWQPQAERVVFINNNEHLFDAEINHREKNLNKRGKNVFEIDVPDTLKSNLSISITDAGVSDEGPAAQNIFSNLLLTGDLRGHVHRPGYYFSSNADSVRQHLDLVMLTNGWRRFKWEDIVKGKFPQIKYQPEQYLSLGGQVTGIQLSRMPKDEQLNLVLLGKDSSRQFVFVPLGSDGKFRDESIVFFDTLTVFYQFNRNRSLSDRAAVSFSVGMYPGSKSINPNGLWRIPMKMDTAMLNRSRYFASEATRIKEILDKRVKVLETVTVQAKRRTRKEELDNQYTNGFFKGGDAYTFDMVEDPFANSAVDIFSFLQGRVAGLMISMGSGEPQLSWRGGTPSLFIDEMQMDASAVRGIPVSDVAYIKVFRPPFFGAFGGGAGGAIAIYTKKGNDRRATIPGLENRRVAGYSAIKQFYSPNYADPSTATEVEDIRTTLFWKPYILTDATNRKVSIEFYNNDVSKKLRVVLEGINEEGKLTRVEKIIE